MEKTYILRGLNCANCAAKIEKEAGELEGVHSSRVDLVKQTLKIQADESVDSSLSHQVEEIVHSHEPDIIVLDAAAERSEDVEQSGHQQTKLWRLFIGALLFIIGLVLQEVMTVSLLISLSFFLLAYLILGGDVIIRAARNIAKGRVFDENFLMSISTIGAMIIGEYPEAVAVMLFYQIGEYFQDMAVNRSRKSIADLMDIRPDYATVIREGEHIVVSPEDVSIDEMILVKPGERVPLDGVVIQGESMLDTRALTGESVPRKVSEGDEILSGCINQQGVLTVQVTRTFETSTVSKIIDLVEIGRAHV